MSRKTPTVGIDILSILTVDSLIFFRGWDDGTILLRATR